MLGNRLKSLRQERLMSLADVAKIVGKSPATLSRYENNLVEKIDLELIKKIAFALESSPAYLLGMTDNSNYIAEIKTANYFTDQDLMNVLVTDDEMEPEIPNGAYVQVRELDTGEELEVGDFYYVEFDNKKVFRMVAEDPINGIGFLPADVRELRISYDTEYVNVIGKVVSMKVFFEDLLD